MKLNCVAAAVAAVGATVLLGQEMTDQQFVEQAAQVNMTEAHLGQLAQQRAASQDVKDFGARIESHHKDGYQKLTAVGASMNVPRAIDATHQKIIDRLENLSGKNFDTQFRQVMINDHQKAISMFERATNQLVNNDLKNYANQMLPVLRDHLAAANDLGKPMQSQTITGGGQESARANAAANSADPTAGPIEQRRPLSAGQTAVEFGTVTKYEKGKVLELKIRDRLGRHVYDLSQSSVAGTPPADLAVGSKVKITETADKNGLRAVRIENDEGSVRSRAAEK